MCTTLILGIGNTLLTDEGVGVHVVNYLQQHHGDEMGVTFLDGGTLSFTLAEPIAEHDNLVVIDAARLKEAAGFSKTLEGDEMDRYLSGNRESDFGRVWQCLTPPASKGPQRCGVCGATADRLRWFCDRCRSFDTFGDG